MHSTKKNEDCNWFKRFCDSHKDPNSCKYIHNINNNLETINSKHNILVCNCDENDNCNQEDSCNDSNYNEDYEEIINSNYHNNNQQYKCTCNDNKNSFDSEDKSPYYENYVSEYPYKHVCNYDKIKGLKQKTLEKFYRIGSSVILNQQQHHHHHQKHTSDNSNTIYKTLDNDHIAAITTTNLPETPIETTTVNSCNTNHATIYTHTATIITSKTNTFNSDSDTLTTCDEICLSASDTEKVCKQLKSSFSLLIFFKSISRFLKTLKSFKFAIRFKKMLYTVLIFVVLILLIQNFNFKISSLIITLIGLLIMKPVILMFNIECPNSRDFHKILNILLKKQKGFFFNINKYHKKLKLKNVSTVLAMIVVLSNLTFYFWNLFYYFLPNSNYFYIKNLINHFISFNNFPEVIEYQKNNFYSSLQKNEFLKC